MRKDASLRSASRFALGLALRARGSRFALARASRSQLAPSALVAVVSKKKSEASLTKTKGNYATWDRNGMCHLRPQWHLLEWREGDERAFVHRDSWISSKGLDNHMPATVNCICKKSL